MIQQQPRPLPILQFMRHRHLLRTTVPLPAPPPHLLPFPAHPPDHHRQARCLWGPRRPARLQGRLVLHQPVLRPPFNPKSYRQTSSALPPYTLWYHIDITTRLSMCLILKEVVLLPSILLPYSKDQLHAEPETCVFLLSSGIESQAKLQAHNYSHVTCSCVFTWLTTD